MIFVENREREEGSGKSVNSTNVVIASGNFSFRFCCEHGNQKKGDCVMSNPARGNGQP